MHPLWRAAGRIVVVFALALPACGKGIDSPANQVPEGGNGGSGSGGNGGANGGVVTPAQRTAALSATEAQAGSLKKQGLTGDAFNQALADFLSKRAEFEAAGVDTETSSVWARFKDGRLLIVPNNRDLKPSGWRPRTQPGDVAPEGSPPAAAANATELPDPVQVRLFHSFGTGFAGQSVIDMVRPWLQKAGYTVLTGAQGDASVEVLRQISGDGFFYFNTHGGKGVTRAGNSMFAMWTSTLATAANDSVPLNLADLNAERLLYMIERNGLIDAKGNPVFETRYAITYKFVDQYMSFGKNSILFFNVCSGGNAHPEVQAFVSATHRKGASVYIGWTKVLSDSLAYTALPYFVDRLLGANQFRPENPKQRPFAWPEVLQDMTNKGLATEPTTGAQLVAYPAVQSGDMAGLLAPSIKWLIADQHKDELYISGIFGADPGTNGKVTIDDGKGPAQVTVKSWKPDQIVVDLPQSGAGAAGDVVVSVRGHDSNPRRLVRWQGSFSYTLRDKGTLTLNITMPFDFRLDPGDFRLKPGEPPQAWPAAVATSNPRMVGDYSASGTYVQTSGPCTYTFTWSGSGKLPLPAGIPPVGYLGTATADAVAHQLTFYPVVSAQYTQTMVAVCSGGSPQTYTTTWDVTVDPAVFDKPGALVAATDALMDLVAGTRTGSVATHVGGANATATLTWPLVPAAPFYNLTQPR